MSRENVEAVKGLLAAFRARDFEASLPCTHPEVQMRPALVGGPEGVVYRGFEGARRFWAEIDLVWAEFRVEPAEFRDLGDRVLVLGRVEARGRQSQIDLCQPAAWLAELRDGRVYRWQSFGSHEEGIEAAGLRSGENLETVRRIYAAFNRRDPDALVEEMGSGFEWHPSPEEPEQQVRLTRDAVLAGVQERWDALERLNTEVEELLDAPPHVVASVRHTAMLEGSDTEITRREVHVWSFDDDGRVVRLREFPTRAAALEAAGLA